MSTYIEREIIEAMACAFDLDIGALNRTASMDTVPQWDSLHHLTLISELEKRFNLNFRDDEVIRFIDFEAIKSIIEESTKS